MLSDIRGFKKGGLKHIDEAEEKKEEAAPALKAAVRAAVPTAAVAPAAGKPAPAVPPKKGSFMAEIKSVSLRKTGVIREVCAACEL